MAARRLPRICWDSCSWISLIAGTPDRLPGLVRVAQVAERGELELITSFLAMAETAKPYFIPERPHQSRQVDAALASLERDDKQQLRVPTTRTDAIASAREHVQQAIDALEVSVSLPACQPARTRCRSTTPKATCSFS